MAFTEDYWLQLPRLQPAPLQQQPFTDEHVIASAPRDESTDWLGFIRPVLLATVLAASAFTTTLAAQQVFSYSQDDLGNLHAPPDEVYNQTFIQWPLSPVPALSMDADAPVPQAVPFQPDEDFWAAPSPWSIASVPQPFTDTDAVTFLPSDDLWQVPQPWPLALVPRVFTDDDVALTQPVIFQPDEYFWMNPVAPIAATLLWPQPWTFDDSKSIRFTQILLLN